ncbi:glutaredoxin [Candidatus Woesearchaeota archaeon]|nr:glutaredoxin [Candidatus Woesearchaeota archaeon]
MQLTLYQFEDCPYCAKVRAKLEEKKISYENVNVSRSREDSLRKKLAEKSGVLTVPVLKMFSENGEEKYIGESGKIIEFLEKF